jgi:hypothetical protein
MSAPNDIVTACINEARRRLKAECGIDCDFGFSWLGGENDGAHWTEGSRLGVAAIPREPVSEAIEQRLADSINRGEGALLRAIEKRYGLAPGARLQR